MDLRKLIFLILLPVCIYGQNEVIRRIEFEDSIRVHSDTLLSHNDRINAVVQLSKDSTSDLRTSINALTDTAGVHLDTLLSHNNRILALLDSVITHTDTLGEHNNRILVLLDSLKNIYTQAQVDGVISDSLARFDDSLGVHSDTLESHNNRTLAILDSLKNIYTESQVDDLLDVKIPYSDTTNSIAMQWELDGKVSKTDSNTIYITKNYVDTAKTNLRTEISGKQATIPNLSDTSKYLEATTPFGGDVTGNYNSIAVIDDSHNHVISNVDDLRTTLDSMANKSAWGNPAGGMLFDGVDDYAFFAFTIPVKGFCVWVYPTVTNKAILTFGTNMSVTFNSSNVVTYGSSFANVTTWINGVASTTLKLNEWNFITATFDEITPTVLELGRSSSTYLTGALALFRAFNRALTAAEIKLLYNNGRPDLANLDYADIGASNTPVYASDFSSGVDGWGGGGGTVTGNVDGIDGLDDVLQLQTNTATSSHYFTRPFSRTVNKNYKRKMKVFIPSANVALKKLLMWANSNWGSSYTVETLDAWVEISLEGIVTDNNWARFYGMSAAGSTTFEGNAADKVYITEVTITPIGCVAEYLPSNAGRLGWIETMNGLHGSTSGSPVSLNAEQRPVIYRDVKLSIANTATTLTNIVPKGYRIASIRAVGSDSLTAIKIGTSSGGEQVVASTTTTGTTPKLLTLAATANDGYSESAATTLYAEHGTAAQTLDLIFTFEKVDR